MNSLENEVHVLIETLWNVKEVAFVHALDTEAY